MERYREVTKAHMSFSEKDRGVICIDRHAKMPSREDPREVAKALRGSDRYRSSELIHDAHSSSSFTGSIGSGMVRSFLLSGVPGV